MVEQREQYTMGYGPAATAIMSGRTAQSHAAFFLPYLKPGMRVLDCGCGPGTITSGFARIVAPGEVVGTEIEETHVQIARETAAAKNVKNTRFETADLYDLPFAEASFDAVFISAVLSNLQEPIRGLREAHRVLRPGGVIGIKEFDHGGDLIYPQEPGIEKYANLYIRLREENNHDPQMGRKIGSLLLEAGFADLSFSATYESFSTPESAVGFAQVSVGLLHEKWGETFVSRGWATNEDLQEMADAWERFARCPGAIFAAAWCEATAHKLVK
jgi:ubiquinone/menaquinone biosynthesis C-methylase UbiE